MIVVVRVRPPPVPVTVTVAAPRVAALEAVNVNTLLVPVAGFEPKLALTPLGNPLALKATLSVKPPVRVTVIALFAVKPRVKFVGVAESAKSGLVVLFAVVNVRSPDVDRLPASSVDFTL